jgi:hypothetical protein
VVGAEDAEADVMSDDGTEYSRQWYDGNGIPYPISGVGTDNSMAPWLMWCDGCRRWHLHNEHKVYDSTQDTKNHIYRVRELLHEGAGNLFQRALAHDKSKLESPEKDAFDVLTPRLKDLTYGSDEYRACLREMKPALDHHYAANSHHPEYFRLGISGMSLFDVVEMLMDWKAAGERHGDGDIWKSLEINKERFNIDNQTYSILINTAREMGW